ncbi:uncharacterized protein PAC_09148 [Phialocephala subalpina]|uniref:Uncharacterized protein n=1 Tax=Phialocephala subalpina TaxID=576137 RepID=A0A1L7X2L0_9HELO|nr:uncharacterized protein PAC_09148 [Phialocephala subalpina]
MSRPTTPCPCLPPPQWIRGHTPVSPLSEELFGDFLDGPPRMTPLPVDLCWIFDDTDDEEESPSACRPPQLDTMDSDRRSPSPPPEPLVEGISAAVSIRSSSPSMPSKHPLPTEEEGQVSEVHLDRSPLFCSTNQQIPMYGGPPGEAIDPQSFISQFMDHMVLVQTQSAFPGALLYNIWAPYSYLVLHKFAPFNVLQPQGHLKSQVSTSCTEPVFKAISKAPHVFEVTMDAIIHVKKDIDGRRIMERREVELSRYFIPSMTHEYLEIHAKDICAGLNPVRERLGQMEGMSPFLVYGCQRSREVEIKLKTRTSDECHTNKRTVYLLKNRLIRGKFPRRRARVVTGEWLVGGINKRWGMILTEAKEYWAMM